MAFFFGDGFDLYSAITDCGTYWDANFGGTVSLGLSSSGRFAGSRGIAIGASGNATAAYITKTSGVNDAVHHLSLAIQQTGALTGTNNGLWFTFFDGATAQCTVVFRSDGALILTSGASNGTTLATYTGAIAAQNTWYQFEIEVVINNVTGSIAVRKLGNTSNDFSLGSLNTRGGTTNNYANKLGVGATLIAPAHAVDDLLWRSDASSVAWLVDIRFYTRMPASDASVQWSRSGSGSVTQVGATHSTGFSVSASQAVLTPIVVNYTGLITSMSIVSAVSMSGNVKGAIWADNSNAPGSVLFASASQAVVSGGAGANVFTVSPSVSVTAGQRIWVGVIDDTAAGQWSVDSSTSGVTITSSFAAFPQANPVPTTGQKRVECSIIMALSGNWGLVAEPQQDGATTYVYSSTVGQSDLYGIASISATPGSIVGVTTRAYMEKSDAGTRIAAVQLQSGASNVQTQLTLNTSWQWAYRSDLVDPSTGAAWTATGVNNAQVGVVVTT